MPGAGTFGGTGIEDQPIAITGLTAASITRADTSAPDTPESLSVIIRNVPAGTRILGAGASNNGDGSWTLNNPADLANLQVIPPTNFSGVLNLELVGLVVEPSTGASVEAVRDLLVTVAPRADLFVIDAQNTLANGATC